MIHLVWGFSLLFSSILVFFYFKKDNRVTAKYLCLFGALIGVILGILNIFVQKYDGYCSICIGVLCIFFTYYDNKCLYIISSRVCSWYWIAFVWYFVWYFSFIDKTLL